ncbi:MAG TPA: multicopper oxidase family protein [Longimicrobiales bacterium]|nr:multicopper oxidase family protein [Longimicrobiales bacterium]
MSSRAFRVIVVVACAATPATAQTNNKAPDSRVVEIDITAAPARLSLIPDATTEVYAYNGTSPGPTLQLREGDRVIVHFKNNLPEPSTIHWHGLHLPANMDGSPYHPVAPGGQRDYVFNIPRGTAGTYWYHPHPDHITGHQVGRGLYGAIVVRADDDPLPTMTEQVVLLSDNRFLADGSIDMPDPKSQAGRMDFENGREGDVVFATGVVKPTFKFRPGEVQRWRIINASGARVYRLALQGMKMLYVGSDGGLFEKPEEVSEITLGIGERAEVLVQANALATKTALQMLPYDRYIPQTRPKNWDVTRDVAYLEISGEAVEPIKIPTSLSKVPALDTTKVSARRVVSLSQGMINGYMMDMNRIDMVGKLGATEIWEIENLVGMDHPFHLHGFQFQIIDRNGVPEKTRKWKDTVNVPKHETVRIIVRFDDFPGKWMFHCHILDHEDHGMMGVLQVK